jgi:hypothetical protein
MKNVIHTNFGLGQAVNVDVLQTLTKLAQKVSLDPQVFVVKLGDQEPQRGPLFGRDHVKLGVCQKVAVNPLKKVVRHWFPHRFRCCAHSHSTGHSNLYRATYSHSQDTGNQDYVGVCCPLLRVHDAQRSHVHDLPPVGFKTVGDMSSGFIKSSESPLEVSPTCQGIILIPAEY